MSFDDRSNGLAALQILPSRGKRPANISVGCAACIRDDPWNYPRQRRRCPVSNGLARLCSLDFPPLVAL